MVLPTYESDGPAHARPANSIEFITTLLVQHQCNLRVIVVAVAVVTELAIEIQSHTTKNILHIHTQ